MLDYDHGVREQEVGQAREPECASERKERKDSTLHTSAHLADIQHKAGGGGSAECLCGLSIVLLMERASLSLPLPSPLECETVSSSI